MKFLFDFFPVLLFYITFKSHENQVEGMVTATGVLIMATLFQVTYTWLKSQKIEKMHIITLLLVVVFGGATMYFKEPGYLIWKVSIANWLFAIVFLGSHYIGKKLIVERMMDHSMQLPKKVWLHLSTSWIVFFVLLGLINLYVGYSYEFTIWVDFKFYGMMGLMLVFVVIQAIFLARHIQPESQTPGNQGED